MKNVLAASSTRRHAALTFTCGTRVSSQQHFSRLSPIELGLCAQRLGLPVDLRIGSFGERRVTGPVSRVHAQRAARR